MISNTVFDGIAQEVSLVALHTSSYLKKPILLSHLHCNTKASLTGIRQRAIQPKVLSSGAPPKVVLLCTTLYPEWCVKAYSPRNAEVTVPTAMLTCP